MTNQKNETAPLRIMAISLAGLQKHEAYAVYNGEQLMVTYIKQIKGAFGTWKPKLIKKLKEMRSRGYVCIVEERTDHIAQHASQFNLEDMDLETGRSNFYMALDWYFSMFEMGNIIIDPGCKKYEIRMGGEGQKIEKTQDEKGRIVYSADWGAINTGHRALLLCVVGAMVEPVSDRYVDDMLKLWLPIEPQEDPLQAFSGSMTRMLQERTERFDAKQNRK